MTEIPTDAESFKRVNKNVIAEFRANAGIVGGLLAGKDVLLLTTTGPQIRQTACIATLLLHHQRKGDHRRLVPGRGY